MSKEVVQIREDELEELLKLYKHLNPSDIEISIDERFISLWKEIVNDPNYYLLGIRDNQTLISSCTLIVIKNLTRGAQPYGLIENVVTHQEYRKQGFGSIILNRAIEIAKEQNCYKIMLMTSRKEESTLRFYEKAGFDRKTKTGFVIYFDR